ncbi:MFS transporter [Aliiglaciecola lipolytica]|uniref:Major facilitator superfamily MFS_1 n=1 Tax=Aliiglaciecola lipolytica E3 TaxID=1127673 RepID=K6Y6M6_9ALTE|nr:MFS transporter [Aliiglaciecola lipolytica]GAC13862.1 major facilitator superfamily MFS_1 [Aliiglaciecola lipolytica E3]
MANQITVDDTQVASWKVDSNGVLARIFLAFLTTAGIFYINIMPALVSGLIQGLNFTNQQAGFVSSSNLYGAAAGALLAVFMVKHINWKKWAYGLLLVIFLVDFASIFITSPYVMIVVRGVHGLVGGLMVGIGFAVISRTQDADKTFGYLLLIQWGLGGLGIMYLPAMVPQYGTTALFVALMSFTFITLLMLPFLRNYPVAKIDPLAEIPAAVRRKPLLLTLLAIFLFQAANMGLFAYVIGLGEAEGLTMDFMSPALASASWVALFGSLLVILIGTKFGRTVPLVAAIIVTALCSWVLIFSEISMVYLIANILIGITWAFALPYMFGICSELDKAGQLAALGGFASKMGLASGPMAAALLLGEDNYQVVIYFATALLIVCTAVVFWPARLLDSEKPKITP